MKSVMNIQLCLFAGIVFVVDSADSERFPEAREELHRVLKDEQIAPGVPMVIMANKQDLPCEFNACFN